MEYLSPNPSAAHPPRASGSRFASAESAIRNPQSAIPPRAFTRVTLLLLLLVATLAARADDGGYLVKRFGADPDLSANVRVQMIGQRLARAAGLRHIELHIYNNGEINAMAFPDGHIYVGAGMAHLASDDELAFILGHEMTHIKEHHSARQVVRALGGAVVGAAATVLLGGGGAAARVGADIGGGLTFGLDSRSDERRADEQGVRFAARAGFDPAQSVTAMTRIYNAYGNGTARTWLTGLYASHPDTTWRVKNLQKSLEAMTTAPVTVLPPPALLELDLDPSAQHGRTWMPSYLAEQLYAHGEGALYVHAAPEHCAIFGEAPEVTPPAWRRDADFTAVLSVREVPAGGAETLDPATGTAVEASIAWTQPASGLHGTLTAIAQTRKSGPWTAEEQLVGIPAAVQRMDDGKHPNVEGTLEATAIRCVARALTELVLAGKPVSHDTPVTVRCFTRKLRPHDTITITRHDRPIAEVRVDSITGPRSLTGTVIWGESMWGEGTHLVKQKAE